MSSKDLRRFALEKWKRNWPTILASFFLLFVAYIALAICFSFILGPFLATTIMFVLTGVRSGINLSIFGILIAFIFFSFIFFLLLGSFSFKALPDAEGTYRLRAVLCSRAVVYLRLIYPFSRLWSSSPTCGDPSGSFHRLLYRAIFAFESLHPLPSFGEKGKESNGCFTHELCPDAS